MAKASIQMASAPGFGLTGMRERALLAGGRLWVRSADGGPTSVSAVLPLPRRVNTLWPARTVTVA